MLVSRAAIQRQTKGFYITRSHLISLETGGKVRRRDSEHWWVWTFLQIGSKSFSPAHTNKRSRGQCSGGGSHHLAQQGAFACTCVCNSVRWTGESLRSRSAADPVAKSGKTRRRVGASAAWGSRNWPQEQKNRKQKSLKCCSAFHSVSFIKLRTHKKHKESLDVWLKAVVFQHSD